MPIEKETDKMIKEFRGVMDKKAEYLNKKDNNETEWSYEIVNKTKGSDHYKSEGLQPFDIYEILPCKGFTPFMVFCSFNILKYIWRICNGSENIDKDIGKIIHYAETFRAIKNRVRGE